MELLFVQRFFVKHPMEYGQSQQSCHQLKSPRESPPCNRKYDHLQQSNDFFTGKLSREKYAQNALHPKFIPQYF